MEVCNCCKKKIRIGGQQKFKVKFLESIIKLGKGNSNTKKLKNFFLIVTQYKSQSSIHSSLNNIFFAVYNQGRFACRVKLKNNLEVF